MSQAMRLKQSIQKYQKYRTNNRENWIDAIKVIACILVVLGHFFQSMKKANIMPDNALYNWFVQTIYYFHVPLFFICSGYLYQKDSNIDNLKTWSKSILNKFIRLGIPYLTFTLITLILKNLFANEVNSQAEGIIETLLIQPTSPYWYLYVLFFIYLVTPTFKSEKIIFITLTFTIIIKLISNYLVLELPYAIRGIINNEIWFIFGMSINLVKLDLKIKAKSYLLIFTFLLMSIFVYLYNISFQEIDFFLGMFACIAIISFIRFKFNDRKNKIFDRFIEYNMPIFLMHSIFAAGLRGLLINIGILNLLIHILLGILISFLGPILTAKIMKKSIILEIFIYPGKFIHIK